MYIQFSTMMTDLVSVCGHVNSLRVTGYRSSHSLFIRSELFVLRYPRHGREKESNRMIVELTPHTTPSAAIIMSASL